MHRLPFDQPGIWCKTNLHMHSNVSDGDLSPADAVAAYAAQGYDAVALTDHFLEKYGQPITDTRALRTGSITTLIGAELHGPALSHGDLWHIVAVGLPLDFALPAEGETGPQIAARAAASGAFVGIAHPAWYRLQLADALLVAPHADAVEVFNSTARSHNDSGDGWYLADGIAMATGKPLFAYAADDTHFRPNRPDTFRSWTMVRAAERSPEAILAALKAGAFYASQGPQIRSVERDGNRLLVETTPVEEAYITGTGWKSASARQRAMTRFSLPLDLFGGSWARLTVVDAAGHRAWTSPFSVEA